MNEVRAREEEASCGGTEPKCPTHSSARGPCESSCERRAGIQSSGKGFAMDVGRKREEEAAGGGMQRSGSSARLEEPQSELAILRDQLLVTGERLVCSERISGMQGRLME
uniref:Uncharacterized protein n=1 Tax=Leersia perrieri TaxID=77586 RepID=A0A0D9V8T5_9ORYZ